MKVNKKISDFQIRKIKTGEFEKVIQLCQPLLSPAFNWPKDKLTLQLSQSINLGLFQNGELLGFFSIVDLDLALEIPVLATAKTYQNSGVMSLLLAELSTLQYRAKTVWLEVHELNRKARALYRKLGFEETGRRAKYYPDGAAAILCTRRPLKQD